MHHSDSIILLIHKELETYRRTARAVHLAHAARAFDEMRELIVRDGTADEGARGDVGASYNRR